MKEVWVFEVNGIRTLPITLMHGRVIKKLPAFGSGKFRAEYVEPVIDPQPFDFTDHSLRLASTHADYAIKALRAWSQHTFQVAYFLQFYCDRDGEACKRVHEHTRLVSAILTRRLGFDDAQLWEAFRWLIEFKFAQEAYWTDPEREANYDTHAAKLDKANEQNNSRAEVGHILDRAATQIELMKGEWAGLPPIKSKLPDSPAGPKMTDAVTVFCSYCHRDEKLRDKLEKHLSPLIREGAIRLWHDHCIRAGDEWKGQIDGNLKTANLILLLISADFVASDYCYDVEMKEAMRRHDAKEARVVPVILRPCDWTKTPFAKLQAKPKDGKPVTRWRKQDEAFFDIAKALRDCISDMKAGPDDAPAKAAAKNPQVIQDGYEIAKRIMDAMLRLEKSIRTYRYGFWQDEIALLDEINSIGTEVDKAFQDGHVLWGDEFAALKRPLKDCVGDFRLAWSRANHSRDERVSDAQREKSWNETKEFLHASDENDEFAQRIRNAIKAIENYLAPHLGRS